MIVIGVVIDLICFFIVLILLFLLLRSCLSFLPLSENLAKASKVWIIVGWIAGSNGSDGDHFFFSLIASLCFLFIDLFEKKFDAKNQVKYVKKTSSGLSIDQGVTFSDKGNKGTINLKYPAKNIGDFEAELSTDPKSNSKFQGKFNKLPVKNLSLTVAVNSSDKDKDFNGPVASAEAEYAQEYASLTAKLVSDQIVHKATVTGSVGFDGFSVGGSIGVNATQSVDITNPAFGVEYSKNNATVSVYSTDSLNVANASVFYKYSKSMLPL